MTHKIETVDALIERVLSPQTPHIEQARSAIAGATNAEDAWEACLAGELIPMSWASDDKRVFGSWVNTISNVPPSVEAVLRVASNTEAMLAAESLARTAMRATTRWAGRDSPSAESVIEWRFFSYGQRGSFDLDTIDRAPIELCELHDVSVSQHRAALDEALEGSSIRWDLAGSNDQSLPPTFFRALRTFARDQQWAALASMHANCFARADSASAEVAPQPPGRRGARPAPPASSVRVVETGDRFDALPNPWTARASMWELGFVLLDAGRDRIVLLSSSVE